MNEDLKREIEKQIKTLLEGRNKVDEKIESLKTERKGFDEQINSLNNAYFVGTGRNFDGLGEFQSAADMAEVLLTEFGELHVDKILELISERQMFR